MICHVVPELTCSKVKRNVKTKTMFNSRPWQALVLTAIKIKVTEEKSQSKAVKMMKK